MTLPAQNMFIKSTPEDQEMQQEGGWFQLTTIKYIQWVSEIQTKVESWNLNFELLVSLRMPDAVIARLYENRMH